MLPAVFWILRETLLNDVIKRRGKEGSHTRDGGGIALQDFRDDAGLAWARESPPPCCHLVQRPRRRQRCRFACRTTLPSNCSGAI